MAYRKLGRTCKHRRSMLANLTKDLIMNERIETTETRAKKAKVQSKKQNINLVDCGNMHRHGCFVELCNLGLRIQQQQVMFFQKYV